MRWGGLNIVMNLNNRQMPIINHENKPPTYICEDCGLNYTHFDGHMLILKEHIWLSIANKKDVLCDSCISIRLKRGVSIDDLWKNEWGNISEINNWFIKQINEK